MVQLTIDYLPPATANVLRRRARGAGMAETDYVRAELVALAADRNPLDAVVEFLETEKPTHSIPEPDADALALIYDYDLPADAWSVFRRRAGAAGLPLSAYVRRELIATARRATIDDAVLELREMQQLNPSAIVDMDAVLESVRYARGE